jgi:hypothetical protein
MRKLIAVFLLVGLLEIALHHELASAIEEESDARISSVFEANHALAKVIDINSKEQLRVAHEIVHRILDLPPAVSVRGEEPSAGVAN